MYHCILHLPTPQLDHEHVHKILAFKIPMFKIPPLPNSQGNSFL